MRCPATWSEKWGSFPEDVALNAGTNVYELAKQTRGWWEKFSNPKKSTCMKCSVGGAPIMVCQGGLGSQFLCVPPRKSHLNPGWQSSGVKLWDWGKTPISMVSLVRHFGSAYAKVMEGP